VQRQSLTRPNACGAAVSVKRLLWVNHFAVTPDMGGGTRHFEIGRELVRRGWAVTVAASDFHLHGRRYTRRSDGSDRSPRLESRDGVQFVWLWAAPYAANNLRRVRNWITFGSSLLRWGRRAGAPDVVIGSTPHLFAAFAAWRLARWHGVPFVLEVRDLWPESLTVGDHRRGPSYQALLRLAQLLYRVADRIVVLTSGVGEYLITFGVPRERVVLVPNGVDVDAFAGETRASRSDLQLVYAGAHGAANGLDVVLHAASNVGSTNGISFTLVGDGPEKPKLVARAKELQLRNVQFREPVSKADIPSLLREADAGLMVLKEVELFRFGVSPNKLFDYWGAALPVVCNVPGEVAGLVSEVGGGVQARDGSGAALADAIRELARIPPEERRAMGERGRIWVSRERDRRILADRMDAALRDLITPTA
jgi:glycosyltransferase involved in cell wall biosynthesis